MVSEVIAAKTVFLHDGHDYVIDGFARDSGFHRIETCIECFEHGIGHGENAGRGFTERDGAHNRRVVAVSDCGNFEVNVIARIYFATRQVPCGNDERSPANMKGGRLG